ncbi:MAG TPA: hypothetical protein VF139_06485 [Candidatus Polarisedimenticolaceae bacterium]
MNRHTTHRNRSCSALVFLLTIAGAAGSAQAEDVLPFLPPSGTPPRIQRLEIVDAPDPIGNGLTLRNTSGDRSDAPTYHPESVPRAPDVAVDPLTGGAVVGWLERVGETDDLVVASANASGWGAPCRVARGAASAPSVAFAPDGSVVAIYVLVSGAQTQAFARTASAPDWRWSLPEPVSLPGEQVSHVNAVIHAGQLHIVYSRRDGPATSLVHATPNAAGYDRSVVATSSFAGGALPQIHSHAGVLWIDWVDAEAPTGAGELAWKRRDAPSTWGATRYEPYASPFDRDYHVRPGLRLQAIAP